MCVFNPKQNFKRNATPIKNQPKFIGSTIWKKLLCEYLSRSSNAFQKVDFVVWQINLAISHGGCSRVSKTRSEKAQEKERSMAASLWLRARMCVRDLKTARFPRNIYVYISVLFV